MISPVALAGDSIGLTAPAHPGAVRLLRADAVKRLRDWGLAPSVVDAAEVVVSELLTNALVHGGADVLVLRLGLRDAALRIEVDDPDCDNWPRLKPDPRPGESGNGMLIVDRLACWGFICGHGKTVYATIQLTEAA